MSDGRSLAAFVGAREDFRRARRRAVLEQILSRLSGRSTALMSYEEVGQKLRMTERKARQLREIPLDAITGSVGRYSDFTRTFLPKMNVDESRWAGVKVAATGLVGLPPIEVYQIGEVYFVLDGNHRVSVARQLGASQIEAYVTEFVSRVPLEPDDQPDDLIRKAEYAEFLDTTGIDRIRPDADLSTTVPGRYALLKEQIQVHRYFLGLDLRRDISLEDAVASWYDTVYLPVVEVIRDRGILQHFPERTETDLYLWALKHRDRLADELGWQVEPAVAAADLSSQARVGPPSTPGGRRSLKGAFSSELGSDDWLADRSKPGQEGHLFAEILVPLSGEEASWAALDQAIAIARREKSVLRGLFVTRAEHDAHPPGSQPGQRNNAGTLSEEGATRVVTGGQAIQADFRQRCEGAGIPGELVIAGGKVSSEICKRSRWTDLVILDLEHPPPPQVLSKLGSGFRTILRCSACPVLAVPRQASPLDRLLLAYDDSPKSREALFVATYLAARWGSHLTVITAVENAGSLAGAQDFAREYLLQQSVEATYAQEEGPTAPTVLKSALTHGCDLIIMGSYGRGPVMEIALGSAVDALLRTSPLPMLICQ